MRSSKLIYAVVMGLAVSFSAQAKQLIDLQYAKDALDRGHAHMPQLNYDKALTSYKDAYAFGNPRGAVGLAVLNAMGLGVPVNMDAAEAYFISADQEPNFDGIEYLTPFWDKSRSKAIATLIAQAWLTRKGHNDHNYKRWLELAASDYR